MKIIDEPRFGEVQRDIQKSQMRLRSPRSEIPASGVQGSYQSIADRITSQLEEIHGGIDEMREQMKVEDKSLVLLECEYLSNIINRCFLVVFCGMVLSVTAVLLLIGYYVHQDVSGS